MWQDEYHIIYDMRHNGLHVPNRNIQNGLSKSRCPLFVKHLLI